MNVDQLNSSYIFSGKLKTTLLIMMGIGALSLAANWMLFDDHSHTRFWSNMLLNSSFFVGIAFTGFLFMSGSLVALAGWMTAHKRLWEAFSMYLPIGAIFMVIIALGVYLGWHDLYHWNDPESVLNDKVLTHKSAFLNKSFYLFGTIIVLATWAGFAIVIRRLSLKEDVTVDTNWGIHRKMRTWGAILLPIAGYSSAFLIWQWIMSVDAHWYSTLFAWYQTISWFDAMLALTILILVYLQSKGFFPQITVEHMHDLGKFLFAFSVFWTYLWFSQFMLIWYSNNGEETGYFKLRKDEYTILHYGILLINFIAPFFILMSNSYKRNKKALVISAIFVFIGHWLDAFLMIKPGVLHTSHELHGGGHGEHVAEAASHGAEAAGHGAEHVVEHALWIFDGFHLPGLVEFGIMVGFLGLFLYVVFSSLAKAKTIPPNDPYYEETLHHHA